MHYGLQSSQAPNRNVNAQVVTFVTPHQAAANNNTTAEVVNYMPTPQQPPSNSQVTEPANQSQSIFIRCEDGTFQPVFFEQTVEQTVEHETDETAAESVLEDGQLAELNLIATIAATVATLQTKTQTMQIDLLCLRNEVAQHRAIGDQTLAAVQELRTAINTAGPQQCPENDAIDFHFERVDTVQMAEQLNEALRDETYYKRLVRYVSAIATFRRHNRIYNYHFFLFRSYSLHTSAVKLP